MKWEAMTGLEMTVHMANGLYSPPSGDVILLDTVGDYGGFAFTSVNELPSSAYSFPREIPEEYRDLTNGESYFATDRWITGRNASYAALNPDVIVATVAGSWHWNSRGGAAITVDNAKFWYQLPDGWEEGKDRPEYAKFGIGNGMPTPELRDAVAQMKGEANATTGHVVVNADGSMILWSLKNLNMDSQVWTDDMGQNWNPVQYFDAEGNPPAEKIDTFFVPDKIVLL